MSAVIETTRPPQLRDVTTEAPWTWLAAGWRDLCRARGVSLAYGLCFALISGGITAGLWYADRLQYLPPLAAGFMLVGPLLAVGLYEVSRRLALGERPGLRHALGAIGRAPTRLSFFALIMMLALLFWIRIAFLLFALFMGTGDVPAPEAMVSLLLFTPKGLGLLVVGTLIGALLAAAIFTISVVSLPLVLDREIDAVSAILLSIAAVRRNWKALLLWAWLIAAITAVGLATFYVGLILLFPLLGHASWHAYRALVA
jgi:uncharacterized membrane protein